MASTQMIGIKRALMRLVPARAGRDLLERNRMAVFIGWSLVLAVCGTAFMMAGILTATHATLDIGMLILVAASGGLILALTGSVIAAQLLQTIGLAPLLFLLSALPGTNADLVMVFAFALIVEASLMGRNSLTYAAAGIAALILSAIAFFPLPPFAAPELVAGMEPWVLSAAVLYGATLLARQQGLSYIQARVSNASRGRARFLAAALQDGVLEFDAEGLLIEASGAAKVLFGATNHEVVACGAREIVHVADRPAFLATLAEVQACREPATIEVRMRASATQPHSGFFWGEVRFHPLPVQTNGRAATDGDTDVFALVRDVTERHDTEERRLRTLKSMEEASAAKSRFLATMSHELRTPLNAIIGFADILDQGVFGPMQNEQQGEYVGLIRDSGLHLLQVVNDILDFSKIEAGHFSVVAEPFNPLPVLARTVEMVRPQMIAKKQELNLVLDDTIKETVGDQRALKQIVLNLLSNAAKFTSEGGKISLRACRDGDAMLISVSDNGIGIPKEHMAAIGQPFYQVDNAYGRQHQGTGLGLSVVRGLVELHDGRFDLTSIEGEGTTVAIRLPLEGPKAGGASVHKLEARQEELGFGPKVKVA